MKELFLSVLTYTKRKWWYLILLFSSTLYVWHFRCFIYQLSELNANNLVFILWLVLLALPLFSEMEILGVKLKKEVEKTKIEVKDAISELRLQIMELKISNTNSNITNNYLGSPLPTKQELGKLSENLPKQPINDATVINHNLEENIKKMGLEVSEQSTFLFQVRLSIEKSISSLCEKTGYNGSKSTLQMLRYLNQREVILNNTVDLISQVLKITNRGVHGEIISDDYTNFVVAAFPEINKQLEEILQRFGDHYYVCPLCRYSGPSKYDNVCPSCGFVSDDD